MNLQIQLTAANCKDCIDSGENLKSLQPRTEIANLDPTEEPNQEKQVDFLAHCIHTWV